MATAQTVVEATLAGDLSPSILGDEWPVPEWFTALDSALAGEAPAAGNALGKALEARGELLGAEVAFAIAERRAGAFGPAAFNRGRLASARGDLRSAVVHYRRALQAQPAHAATWCNLGNALARRGDREAAREALARACALSPGNQTIRQNLREMEADDRPPWRRAYDRGLIDFEADRQGDAREALREAMALGGPAEEILPTLGETYLHEHDFPEALECARQAELASPIPRAGPAWLRVHLAFAGGDWEEGWRCWRNEWRPRWPVRPGHASRPWRGETGAAVRLLVIVDQGAGDTIQCARLLPWLNGRVGGAVALEVAPRMRRILALLLESTALPDDPDAWSPTHHVALSDLPAWHGGPPESMPHPAALEPAPEGVADWRTRLGALPGDGPIVGLAWQGNRRYADDARRSPRLRQLAALMAVGGARIVSLQHGEGREQLADFPTIPDLGAGLDRHDAFVETAALARACDLVITSDSALAHLVPSVGGRAWVMLSHTPDWRWGFSGDGTGWYPGMRLFRQRRPGDWEDVAERLAEALRQEFTSWRRR